MNFSSKFAANCLFIFVAAVRQVLEDTKDFEKIPDGT